MNNFASESRTVTFGYADSATNCIDDVLGKEELPPFPPVQVLDVRFRDHRTGNPFCLGEGVHINYYPLPAAEMCDTFLIIFQPGEGGYPVRFGWSSGLGYYFNSIQLVDVFGGVLHDVDMTTTTELTVTNSGITRLYIIACLKSFDGLPPVVMTELAQEGNQNSVRLYGSVVTYMPPTQVWFEWGTSTAYGNATPRQTLESGFFATQYFDDLHNLERNTTYHFRAVAENIFGVSYGNDLTFTLPAGPPLAITEVVEKIDQHTVSVYGSVSTNGDATEAWFEWGTSPSYGNVTRRQYFEGRSTSTLFSDELNNLEENTTYHFRAVAENHFGISYGEDMTFIIRKERSFRIPLFLTDFFIVDSLAFGIDPQATFCLDYELGEAELPSPPPEGVFDVRFVNPRSPAYDCFGSGTRLDLRSALTCFPEWCTQVDTYLVRFQKSLEASGKFNVWWPDLHPYYNNGPVLLIYGNTIIDMMVQNSDILYASEQSYFLIIAADSFGVTPPPPPLVDTSLFLYSVRDVPFDQGGLVSVQWKASSLDMNEHIIEFYSIWRATPENRKVSFRLIVPSEITSTFNGRGYRLIPMNGQDYAWEFVGTQPAHRFARYAYTAPTLYDSMAGTDGKHYFLVSAHTADAEVFYDSNVDSGYSVDNLRPAPPRNFSIKESGFFYSLGWEPSPDDDVAQYVVFVGDTPNFDIDSAWFLFQTTETYGLLGDLYRIGYYAVCAQDVHGNISDKSNEVPLGINAVSSSSNVPEKFALSQNYPNPFNPSTTFSFELPQEGFVVMKVFNPLGQEVRTLANAQYAAGRYSVDFDGTGLESGVYFYQLSVTNQETGSILFRDVKKFLLLK